MAVIVEEKEPAKPVTLTVRDKVAIAGMVLTVLGFLGRAIFLAADTRAEVVALRAEVSELKSVREDVTNLKIWRNGIDVTLRAVLKEWNQ